MKAAFEDRKWKRFQHDETVLLEDENRGTFSYGKINNMSGEGMYFETEFAFRPGTIVSFRLENPPFKSCSSTFRGIIRWCNELYEEDRSNYPFGVGVEFC